LQNAGVIPAKVKFQVSLPTPIAPIYNNMVPSDRAVLVPALTQHFIGEVGKIAAAIPHDRVAVQWDVCQEVLAWEGYYEQGPVDFRTETLAVLTRIGTAMPAAIELGYHLCYGSPADEHCVQPKDMGIMVEMANASARESPARSSSFICQCRRAAPTTPISRRSKICAGVRTPSFISASSITAIRQAMRRAFPRHNAMRTASARNAAWRAAIRRACPRFSLHISARPNLRFRRSCSTSDTVACRE
jgi:hypothetical protein